MVNRQDPNPIKVSGRHQTGRSKKSLFPDSGWIEARE
jgi:hypothetical protein